MLKTNSIKQLHREASGLPGSSPITKRARRRASNGDQHNADRHEFVQQPNRCNEHNFNGQRGHRRDVPRLMQGRLQAHEPLQLLHQEKSSPGRRPHRPQVPGPGRGPGERDPEADRGQEPRGGHERRQPALGSHEELPDGQEQVLAVQLFDCESHAEPAPLGALA